MTLLRQRTHLVMRCSMCRTLKRCPRRGRSPTAAPRPIPHRHTATPRGQRYGPVPAHAAGQARYEASCLAALAAARVPPRHRHRTPSGHRLPQPEAMWAGGASRHAPAPRLDTGLRRPAGPLVRPRLSTTTSLPTYPLTPPPTPPHPSLHSSFSLTFLTPSLPFFFFLPPSLLSPYPVAMTFLSCRRLSSPFYLSV